MKVIKRIMVWSILPLCIELIGLLYVDKIYLKPSSDYTIEKVEEKKEKVVKNLEIPLDENAQDIKLSYNGKYISYVKDNNIEIINTLNGEKVNVDTSSEGELNYYTWLPDRNRMYIGEKVRNVNGESSIKLYYYDRDKNEKNQVIDNHYNKIKIPLANSKYNIKDIVISTLTGVSYIKVETNNKRYNIYRLNTMSQMEKYKGYIRVGNVQILNRDDRMIYEDLAYGRVRITDRENSLRIPGAEKLCLLGVDTEDRIYLGRVRNDKVDKIYYGTIEEDEKLWQSKSIAGAVDKEDIYISSKGKVYINHKEKNVITELFSGAEKQYNGKIVQYYNKGVGTLYNGKFVKMEL
ncbi:hypothetical protein [Clostridium lundense]|uniref:hypothetical protein n=1 Tax=Clostridium lundense TaxID=319475 RepID=UPI000484AB25|nr:hypothetical protein [Clostridium lundense]